MNLRELIKNVQQRTGFSDDESKDALQMMVEALAVRLNERERLSFAAELLEELQDLALAVYPTHENSSMDIVKQFMEMEHIEANRALQQIQAAWQALKDVLSSSKLNHLRSQLPSSLVAYLN